MVLPLLWTLEWKEGVNRWSGKGQETIPPEIRMLGYLDHLQASQLSHLDGADEQLPHVNAIHVHVHIGPAWEAVGAPEEDVIEKQQG